jgi:hypothetical protein
LRLGCADRLLEIINPADENAIQRRQAPANLAFAYANQEVIDRQDLAEAEALVTALEDQQKDRQKIADALEGEISAAQRRLEQCERDRLQAVSAVVSTSEEFIILLQAIDTAWFRLRSLRHPADMVQHTLHSHLPTEMIRTIQAVQPTIVCILAKGSGD